MARGKVREQAEAYRRLMGQSALERQISPKRCATCLGTLPAGHSRDCPWYGGREPLPPRAA